mmetsp:Transcript_26180/g.60856  ORF Transcript_26180/g.60856 Transcript_26180/m.60856 type:complete len:92 (+) Transcript_26180:304-579(+)
MWKISNLVWFSPPKNLEECDDSKEKRERNHFGKKIPHRAPSEFSATHNPFVSFSFVLIFLVQEVSNELLEQWVVCGRLSSTNISGEKTPHT